MRSKVACLAGASLVVAALGCNRGSDANTGVVPNQGLIEGVGTIVYMTVEGGFYAIQSDDGAIYDPQSLPSGFQLDGLRVRFTVRILSGVISYHQVGPIVEVLDIRPLT